MLGDAHGAGSGAFEAYAAIYLIRDYETTTIHALIDVAGDKRLVAAERIFETEADANEEARTWNRFIAEMTAKPVARTIQAGGRRVVGLPPMVSPRQRHFRMAVAEC